MRMRVIGWQVQPVIMADDGENLTPVEVQGAFVAARQWVEFKTGGDVRALKELRAQVEGGNGDDSVSPAPDDSGISA